jgi:hypothetical protein
LGRFCAKRTQVFHKFTHWEVSLGSKFPPSNVTETTARSATQYSLYQALSREVDELHDNQGARGFVRVAYAKGIKPPKDLTDADGIMDWLDQRGIISMEWQIVRDLMESARNLEMAAKRGGDDLDVS